MRSPKNARLFLGSATAAAALLVAAGAAPASPSFGVRAGVNLDREDPLVGVELLAPLQGGWWANPNLEVTFGDRVDVVGLNADFHYDFERSGSGSAYFWLGTGLAVLFADYEGGGDDTDVGVNLLMGVGLPTASGVVPYFQGKATVSDDTDGSLAFGIRF